MKPKKDYAKVIGAKKIASRVIRDANAIKALNPKQFSQMINYGLPPVTDPVGKYQC